ncbi:MAG: tyrosine--tRNA ligase [Bacillaceae bacterium]|nr:tyrosine--tRNA ligase [Bacillaceae bacterium]
MSTIQDKETDLTLNETEKKELERQLSVIQRGAAEIVPEEDLRKKIIKSVKTGKPLKIKLGLDPSAPDIHVGHTVVLHKMRQFQELGHRIQLVIGDFTGRIGDPTGKSETRKQLTEEEVKRNAETYVEQFSKILDMDNIDIFYNSKWLASMNFSDVIQLASKTTVARMLERDDFEKRFKSNQAISLHEFFYPLMQGYDSVAMETDIELGGTDQKFNLLMGRQLQREFGQEQQVAIMMPLLEGLDGTQKMSKSLGNYIGIDESPNDIFGKTMSIPDELMIKYFELATDISGDELDRLKKDLDEGSVHPRDMKMKLAQKFVTMFHGENAAEEAEKHFKTVFQKRALPEDIQAVEIKADQLEEGRMWIVSLIVELGLCSSNSEARRMVQQGAVKIDEQKVQDVQAQVDVEPDMVVQVGKRKFARVRLV